MLTRRWQVRAVLTHDALGRRVDYTCDQPDRFHTRWGAKRFAAGMRRHGFGILPIELIVERVR